MTEPSLSVVIPSFNRGGLIGRALKSVLAEINHADEIIVVDDGSTDHTAEIIEELSDRRIRYIRQSNAGAGTARNRGAAEASNELLAYLDSDDEWLPGKTEAQRTFMAAHSTLLNVLKDRAQLKNGSGHHNGWLFRMRV